uniref:Gypsy retrotransposon integrase-like protein 1 n=1 Tax=Pelodiscus sinensis TaxID=13735 RepID=K7EY36_PELSI
MHDWERNGWKAADGKSVAYVEEWKWIYQWVLQHPGCLKVRHVKAHSRQDTPEAFWNNKVDGIARQYDIAALVTRSQAGKVMGDPQSMDEIINDNNCPNSPNRTPGKIEKQELVNVAHQFMHEGVEGTLRRLREVAQWKGMEDDVKTWVQNCIRCAQDKARPPHYQPLMHQRRVGPWHRIQIDYIDKLPRSQEGFRYLLVIIDAFSGWVEAFPTRRNTTTEAAKKLFTEVVCRYGTPEIIDSDNGGAFVGEMFTSLLRALGIKHKFHIPYRPQSSGQVALRKVVSNTGKHPLCSTKGPTDTDTDFESGIYLHMRGLL